jgi:hypothetical protein
MDQFTFDDATRQVRHVLGAAVELLPSGRVRVWNPDRYPGPERDLIKGAMAEVAKALAAGKLRRP